MKEHRVIEKMIGLIGDELSRIKGTGKADVRFIDTAVDFIRVYADQCHHGKEEDILFRDLEKKDISADHRKIMDELIEEHLYGRKVVGSLVEARRKYEAGDEKELAAIRDLLGKLVDFYPGHIDKEDHHFFKPVMEYFSDKEIKAMLDECREYDMNMIHEKYRNVVNDLSAARGLK